MPVAETRMKDYKKELAPLIYIARRMAYLGFNEQCTK